MREPTPGDRINALNTDIQRTLGRHDEALDMLAAWCKEHPEDVGLVRMTNNLLARCGREPVAAPDSGKPSIIGLEDRR